MQIADSVVSPSQLLYESREFELFRPSSPFSPYYMYAKPEAELRFPRYSSMASVSVRNPGGSRPSLSIFSNRMISSRLLAFLIISWSRFFSASVSFIRASLDVSAGPSVSAAAGPLDLVPRI